MSDVSAKTASVANNKTMRVRMEVNLRRTTPSGDRLRRFCLFTALSFRDAEPWEAPRNLVSPPDSRFLTRLASSGIRNASLFFELDEFNKICPCLCGDLLKHVISRSRTVGSPSQF